MAAECRYSWEEYYLAAILETNNAKLTDCISKAHAAITSRRQELALDHGGTSDEQQRLSDAFQGLAVLSRDRIGEFSTGRAKESTDSGDQNAG